MEASVVTLNLKLEAATKKEGNNWIARCIPIDVATQSKTKKKALEALEEAVGLWFESCLERDVLSDALNEAGFTKAKSGELVPDHASVVHMVESRPRQTIYKEAPEYIEVNVPAYIAAHLDILREAS